MKGGKYAKLSPRLRSEEYFIYEISKEKRFNQMYRDAMLVPIRMSSNMVDGNQQKHLLTSFATKARIYSSRNS